MPSDFDPIGYLKNKYQEAKDYIANDPELSTYADIAKTGLGGLKDMLNTGATVFQNTSPGAFAFSQAGNPNPENANLLYQIGHVPGAELAAGPFGIIQGGGETSNAVEQTLQSIKGEGNPLSRAQVLEKLGLLDQGTQSSGLMRPEGFSEKNINNNFQALQGGGESTSSPSLTLQPIPGQIPDASAPPDLYERTGNSNAIRNFPNIFGVTGTIDNLKNPPSGWDLTPTEELMVNKWAELIKDGHNEPYYGKPLGNPIWRDKSVDPIAEQMLHPLPARTDESDLGGVLGKGVPNATGADPFSWMEQKYGATAKTLENNWNTPLQIHTRHDLIGHDSMMELLNPAKHEINMHFSTKDRELGHILEPGEPSFERRLRAAKRLKSEGFKVNLVQDNLVGAPTEPVEFYDGKQFPLPTDQLSIQRLEKETGLPVKQNNIQLTDDAIERIKKATGVNVDE